MSSASEVIFLSRELVLAMHEVQIEEHGGMNGIRDEGLLDSALAQPMAYFGGQFLHGDMFEMAAAYLFHVANNHPFLDGNKRTALACCLTFLRLNGITVVEENDTDLADLVLEMIEQHREKSWATDELRRRVAPSQ